MTPNDENAANMTNILLYSLKHYQEYRQKIPKKRMIWRVQKFQSMVPSQTRQTADSNIEANAVTL